MTAKEKTYYFELVRAAQLYDSMTASADKTRLVGLESVKKAYDDAMERALQTHDRSTASAYKALFTPATAPRVRYKWAFPGGGESIDVPKYLGVADTRAEAEAALERHTGPLDKLIRKVNSDDKTAYYRPLEPGYDILVGLISPVEEVEE